MHSTTNSHGKFKAPFPFLHQVTLLNDQQTNTTAVATRALVRKPHKQSQLSVVEVEFVGTTMVVMTSEGWMATSKKEQN